MYATPDDLLARYDGELLAELTGAVDAVPDDAKLRVALADASGEVDGYLARRYATPLAPVPPVIVRLVCAIAVYNLATLHRHSDVEDIAKRYEHAVAFLRRVAEGTAALGQPGDGSPDGAARAGTAESGGAVFVEGSDRRAGRDSLRGF